MRLIGAHQSTAGGMFMAVERAKAIGGNCVQVFSGSPRVWQRTPLEKIDTAKLFSKQRELSVSPIFTHAMYLTNVASDNPDLVRKSIEALKHDLRFDSLVKGSGVIVHLGSHQKRGWQSVQQQVVTALKDILSDTPADSHFLIENSASPNGKLCSDLADIRYLLDQVDSPRLGWCFDTCHAWTAGYALGDPQTKMAAPDLLTEPKNAIETITQLNLWQTLTCIHVNDSRDPFASGRDRHANLGDGKIPPADFRFFLNSDQVKHVPLILEVPGLDDLGPDAENIKRLKALVGE